MRSFKLGFADGTTRWQFAGNPRDAVDWWLDRNPDVDRSTVVSVWSQEKRLVDPKRWRDPVVRELVKA